MAGMKVNVDMSELDEAIEKAERLLAMMNEIDARTDRGNLTAPLAGNIDVRTFPSTPRLNPDGQGYLCDQCGKSWRAGEDPGCTPCAAAFDARG